MIDAVLKVNEGRHAIMKKLLLSRRDGVFTSYAVRLKPQKYTPGLARVLKYQNSSVSCKRVV